MENKNRLVIAENSHGIRHSETIIKAIQENVRLALHSFKKLDIQYELTLRDIASLSSRPDGIDPFLRKVILDSKKSESFVIEGIHIEKSALRDMIKLPDHSAFRSYVLKIGSSVQSLQDQYSNIYRVWQSVVQIVDGNVVLNDDTFNLARDKDCRTILYDDQKIEAFTKLTEFCTFLNSNIVASTDDPTRWMNPEYWRNIFVFNDREKVFELNRNYFK